MRNFNAERLEELSGEISSVLEALAGLEDAWTSTHRREREGRIEVAVAGYSFAASAHAVRAMISEGKDKLRGELESLVKQVAVNASLSLVIEDTKDGS